MNLDIPMTVLGGSWYNDREPYHRADVSCFFGTASVRGYTQGFRTYRPLRIPSRLPVMPPRTRGETLTRWWVT